MPLMRLMREATLAIFILSPVWSGGADQTGGGGQGSRGRVPRAVEIAARHGTVEQFANAAAAAQMPLGIVIAAEDNRHHKSWRPSRDDAEGPSADFADVVGLFEARHPQYIVRHADRVLRIRPATEGPCVRAVERKFEGVTSSGSAFEVVYEAVRARNGDRRPAPPPGFVGSSRDQSGSPDPYGTFVSVDLRDVSLADLLDAVIEDAPGLGWAVRELRDDAGETRCNVVLFAGDSWTDSALYIDLATHERKQK